MVTAKVLENTGEEIKLGFDDGSFRTVAAKDIGFAAPVGSKIDVYENRNGENTEYAYSQHKNSSGSINLDVQSTQDGKTLVNKVAYCVLAFFVGGVGAHKFYAHKYVNGVLYLVFCWTFIPSLIAFIEFIIALTRTPDEDGNIAV